MLNTRLRNAMSRCFNRQDIKTIMFDMGIDSDRFPNVGKTELIELLIEDMTAKNRLFELVRVCGRKNSYFKQVYR